MTNVEYETRELVREIRRSNEYNQYQRLRRKLSRDSALMERLDQYRRECFYIQAGDPAQDDTHRLLQLEKDNNDILSQPSVREFLLSEQKLCRMISRITTAVTQAADLQLDL